MQHLIWTIFLKHSPAAQGIQSPGSTPQNYLAEIKGVSEFGLTGSRAGRWLLPLAADQYKWLF